MPKKTRSRTNAHGLTSDEVLRALRGEYPKAVKIARRGSTVCLWRRPLSGEEASLNSGCVIEELGEFDSFRYTSDGRLTTRP